MPVQSDGRFEENPELKVEEGQIERNCKPWRERGTTEKALCIMIIILFMILLVMLGLLIRAKVSGHERIIYHYEVCSTPICIKEASRFLRNGNYSLDPCQNFQKYACGISQEKESTTYNFYSFSTDVLRERFLLLQSLLDDSSSEVDFEALLKARTFYHSCQHREWTQSRKSIVMELLQKAGLVDGPMSNNDVFKREKTLALLNIHGDKNPFFRFRRKNDVIELYPGHPVINPAVLLDDSNEHMIRRIKYEQLINRTFLNFHTNSKEAGKDAEEMVRFEKSLASLTTMKCEWSPLEITIQKLDRLFPELNWSVIIKYIYDFYGMGKEFSPTLKILVICEAYVKKMLQLLDKFNMRVVEYFITWSFTVNYLPLLDMGFRQEYKEIAEAFDNHWSRDLYESNRKMCIFATGYYFNAPLSVLYEKYEDLNQTEEQINELFANVKSTYKEFISIQKWLDESSKTQCKTTVKEMQMTIIGSSVSQEVDAVNKMFSWVNITDDIVQNILAIDRAIYIENIMETAVSPVQSHPMDIDIHYSPNTISASLGLTMYPVYSIRAPKYVAYSTVGFMVANKISLILQSTENITVSAENSIEFQEREKCLLEQYSECIIGKDEMENDQLLIDVNVGYQNGLLIAFKAYQKYIQQNGREVLLPGLNLTGEQLFFVNFAQMTCQLSREKNLSNGNNVHIHNICRINDVLQNTPQFSEAFSCVEDSFMNPVKKCKVWE